MSRFFNTTGPCNPERHYILPAHERLVGARLDRYIKNQLYWVLHAPRQTGKTTFLQSWMRQINSSGEGIACYVSVERCQGFPAAEDAIPAVCRAIVEFAGKELLPEFVPEYQAMEPGSQLSAMLTAWSAQVAPLPLIILFDEVDTLQDQAMISFLRQLRSGFAARSIGKFPVSVALVGMRDLRDYLIQSKDGVALNPGSPFNIKESSATLSNFSMNDVERLLAQHTTETGQKFMPDAVKLVYDLTRGQPWLVNALGKKCAWELVPEETRQTVTVDHIMQAKELLIRERAVHLDSLAERLKDPRVKRIVEAILVGKNDPTIGRANRDVELCLDLGLITWENSLRIANPIYQEIIPRILSQNVQDNVPEPEWRWQKDDGSLDYAALFTEFQAFWRRNSDAWESKMEYVEAFPHLLVMAFLQRVINGGGRIEREYAAGRGRVDLAVEWHGIWAVIEIKLVHPQDSLETTIEEGLKQTARYRDTVAAQESWLIVFDRREKSRSLPWEQRLSMRTADGINIVTC
ncbi:MAG: AAA family ATPase [Candidatus Riflebacteria bacterium]